jgi:hypothetical protein
MAANLATPVLFVLFLCLPIASMAVSNAQAEAQPLSPILSPILASAPTGPEGKARTFESHPAVPVHASMELSTRQEQAGVGRKTLRPSELKVVNKATSSILPSNIGGPALELSGPASNSTSQWPTPKGSSAKAGVCSPSTWYATVNKPCRVYIYKNKAGTQVGIYTGSFVDSTHVVTTGQAVAPGGTGTYSLFAVNGRYGTVCCQPAGLDPASCPAGQGWNITKAVTTAGWFNKGFINNAGAVLKVVGPGTPPIITWSALQCPSQNAVHFCQFPAYPYPSSATGCLDVTDGNLIPYSSEAMSTGNANLANPTCSVDPGSPTWQFIGGACDGALGAPFYDYGNNLGSKINLGILVSVSSICSGGHATVGFAGVTDGGTTWGFALKKMVAALS